MKRFFWALSFVTLATACSKKATTSQNVDTILRTGKWTMSSVQVRFKLPSGLDTTVDMLGTRFFPTCKRGVSITFNSGVYGSLNFGGTPCQPEDPTEVDFQWNLTNNNTGLHLYNGFNLVYLMTDTILPFFFDTLVNNPAATPPLVLDSIVQYGPPLYMDTSFEGNPNYIVLDSMWNLKFDSIPDQNIDIYGQLSNVTSTSFTLTFSQFEVYPDSTNHHGTDPIYRPDTAFYTVGFTN